MVVDRKLKIGTALVLAGALTYYVASSLQKQATLAAAIKTSETEVNVARASMEEAYQAQLDLLAFWLSNKSILKRMANPAPLPALVQRLKGNELRTDQQMKQFDADLVVVANAFAELAPALHPEDQRRLFAVDQEVNSSRARFSEIAYKHNKLIATAQSSQALSLAEQNFKTETLFEIDRLLLEATEAAASRY